MSRAATPQNPTTTTMMIHIMALDSMVNANSLFTFALFVGMVNVPINPIDPSYTLINSSSHHHAIKGCHHTNTHDDNDPYNSTMADNLIAFHLYSFTSFLFSTLVALTLKQAIKISSSSSSRDQFSNSVCSSSWSRRRDLDRGGLMLVRVNRRMLLTGILASSAGSVSGCVFLVLALVDLVHIKLGTVFICGGYNLYSAAAIGPLLVLVPFSLLAYICILFYAFVN